MSVLRFSTASTQTSPPRPPSPPLGPPNSMNFSRRNETQPLPPAPLAMCTLAVSRNFMAGFYTANMDPASCHLNAKRRRWHGLLNSAKRRTILRRAFRGTPREHRDIGPALETFPKFHFAVAESEQRVVFSHSYIAPR